MPIKKPPACKVNAANNK